jgi:hypothetical protein
MIKNWSHIALPLLIGFGIGICISLILAGILYANRFNQFLAAITPTSFNLTTIPTQTQVRERETVAPVTEILKPFTSEKELLAQAEAEILAGEPEKVEKLLLPVIEKWSSSTDKAHGYKLLGDAVVTKGHPQLAMPYYEKAYFYDPTPDNLFTIAITEDMGGDLCSAFKHYQELDAWEDAKGTFDREFVKSRIKNISCTLGTKTP